MWKDIVEADRKRITIWPMHIAYWITKAINTHSEYAIFIDFPRKKWLHGRTTLLYYMCITCVVFPWWHTKIRIENWNIQGVFKKCLYKLDAWVLDTRTVPINVCSQTLSYGGTASTFAHPQSCVFLSTGTLESLMYSSPIEHTETIYQLTLGACQTFETAPGPVTGCNSPWSYMAICALI